MSVATLSRASRPPVNPGVLIAVPVTLYALLTVWVFSDVLGSCGTRIAAPMGDGLTYIPWFNWIASQQGFPPWQSWTQYANFPVGEPFFPGIQITSLVVVAPNWIFTPLVGPICSTTLVSALGLFGTAASMFALLYYLTRMFPVALLAGVSYGFGIFPILKVQHHMAWAHTWVLILLVLALIALWRRPTKLRALAVGVFATLGTYTDGYMTISVVLIIGAFVATSFASRFLHRLPRYPAGLFAHLLPAIFFWLLAALPLAWLMLTGAPGAGSGPVLRPIEDLYGYAPRWHSYLIPDLTHPYFSMLPLAELHAELGFRPDRLNELFLGITVVVGLALLAAAILSRRALLDPIQRFSIAFLVLLALAAVAISLPPTVSLGSIEFTMPSGLLYEAFPVWRVLWRFGQLVLMAATILAFLGWAFLYRSFRSQLMRAVSLVALLALTTFDIGFPAALRIHAFDYKLAPAVYTWLKEQPRESGEAIADLTIPRDVDALHATWQPIHGWPTTNTRLSTWANHQNHDALVAFMGPQVACLANSLGVKYLVRHSAPDDEPRISYLNPGPVFRFGSQVPEWSGEQLKRQLPYQHWYDTRVYSTTDQSRKTLGYLRYVFGWGEASSANGERFAPSLPDGSFLQLEPLVPGDTRSLPVSFQLRSYAGIRTVEVLQNGIRVWSGEVGPEWMMVRFTGQLGSTIEIAGTGDFAGDPAVDVGFLATGDCANS